MTLRFETVVAGKLCCNSIVVWSEASGRAVLIDPSDDARPIIGAVGKRGLQVDRILLTHGHVDHAADAERAMQAFGQPALLHAADLPVYAAMPHYGSASGIDVPPLTRELGNLAPRTIERQRKAFWEVARWWRTAGVRREIRPVRIARIPRFGRQAEWLGSGPQPCSSGLDKRTWAWR